MWAGRGADVGQSEGFRAAVSTRPDGKARRDKSRKAWQQARHGTARHGTARHGTAHVHTFSDASVTVISPTKPAARISRTCSQMAKLR